ncbi:MAG TPA: SDR family NAD(P)-dependent oxidoreductase [Clostridiaceae bacterium]
MNKAIIIGASSGIGRELAKILSKEKYVIGLAARRNELLLELQRELHTKSYVKIIDISKQDEAMGKLAELINEMDGVDLIIITSGIDHINKELNWDKERETIDVNVTGVTSMINVSLKHFLEKDFGQLVVISSIGCLRGNREAPAYNASKAYISNYLDGISYKIKKDKANITITDVRPGLVDTDMAKGEGLFWVQSPKKVAFQIYKKIKQKKRVAYVTKRWGIIAFLIKHMPDWIYYRI